MHYSVQKYKEIIDSINLKLEKYKNLNHPKIIAVSKTFNLEKIMPLIEYGHLDFGENKVQEAIDKWSKIKIEKLNLKLHLIGKLQTNKVKHALKIFDYIHSLDSEKLAKKIFDEEIKQKKKIKLFIQVNIGEEEQKSGVNINHLDKFISYCNKLNLNIIGHMCIPPIHEDPVKYFEQMKLLKLKLNLKDLSMGMSSDYLKALENGATFVRIGSSIFGPRV